MSNNKQSSVQWAIDKITMICAMYNNKEMSVETFEYYHKDISTKAKAWHKEEITKAWKNGDGKFDKVAEQMSSEYYNETFGE